LLGVTVTDIIGDIGGVAGVIAGLGGSWFALMYGRKANATVTATAQLTPHLEVVLGVRPTVSGVGLFRTKLLGTSRLHVTQVVSGPDGLSLGTPWMNTFEWPAPFIVPGETLSTEVVFDLGAARAEVVGWRVYLFVDARRLSAAKGQWGDRIYVSAPKPDDVHAPAGHGVGAGLAQPRIATAHADAAAFAVPDPNGFIANEGGGG
jgi:hypothetical protein